MILALIPLLKPEALDIFFTRNKNFDREYTEFGGVLNSGGKRFYPSFQTVVFILAGDDIPGRVRAQDFFSSESPLVKNKILDLGHTILVHVVPYSRRMVSHLVHHLPVGTLKIHVTLEKITVGIHVSHNELVIYDPVGIEEIGITGIIVYDHLVYPVKPELIAL